MRLFNRPPKAEKYFLDNSVQSQPATNKLFVAHSNDQVLVTGRITTTYRATDETNDPASAGSFYLLPDPYSKDINCENKDKQDLLSDEGEMMLYNLPLFTNESLHKI